MIAPLTHISCREKLPPIGAETYHVVFRHMPLTDIEETFMITQPICLGQLYSELGLMKIAVCV